MKFSHLKSNNFTSTTDKYSHFQFYTIYTFETHNCVGRHHHLLLDVVAVVLFISVFSLSVVIGLVDVVLVVVGVDFG